jgi:hypothetical protein
MQCGRVERFTAFTKQCFNLNTFKKGFVTALGYELINPPRICGYDKGFQRCIVMVVHEFSKQDAVIAASIPTAHYLTCGHPRDVSTVLREIGSIVVGLLVYCLVRSVVKQFGIFNYSISVSGFSIKALCNEKV